MSLASMLVCAAFKKGDDKRDAGLTTPEDIVRFNDIPYGPDPKENLLDVYRPRNAEGKLPVIVSVHGGGWVYGDKDRYQYYCMSLAQQGFAVVHFTYRLAPKHNFPAPLADTNAVFSWLLANAETYGFDTEHVFALGDSAGAHILGLYCCACTGPDYAASIPLRIQPGFVPTAVALNCGAYHMLQKKKRDLTDSLMRDFLPNKGTEEELHRISVLEHVNAKFPPCFIMTCEGDFLAEQAMPLVEKLRALGVKAEYHYYGDREHVLGHVFHCNIRSEDARRCNRDECEYFKGFLGEAK